MSDNRQTLKLRAYEVVPGAKTFTENWVGKQSFFVLILTTAKNVFFRNKTFLFFKIES